MKTPEDSAKLPFGAARATGLGGRVVAQSEEPAALSRSADERRRAAAGRLAKWAANAPLAFVDQYIGNLRQYRAIAIDVGDQDGLRVGAANCTTILDSYGIANTFEIYPGTHTSAVADPLSELT